MTSVSTTPSGRPILVLGGSGTTGSRVAQRLTAAGVPVRIGSRAATPPFDWQDQHTWIPALENMAAVYIAFYPDLAVPGAPDAIRAFAGLAVRLGVRRLVLLSSRGEEKAQHCEAIVKACGAEWTIVRSSWFAQNWSEGFMRDLVRSGKVALPAGEIREPFIDVDDIADIAVAALRDDRHAGKLYEVTGPRLLTFGEAVAEITAATGRPIRYLPITHAQYAAGLAEQGVPAEWTELLQYLFKTVLDGRNSYVANGVQHALGRQPRAFEEYVRVAAAAGAWHSDVAAETASS